MSNLLSGLSNLGNAFSSGSNAYDAVMERKRLAQMGALQQQAEQQQLQQRQQTFDLQQKELQRQQQAATMLSGMFGRGTQGGQPGGIPGSMPGQPQSGVPMQMPVPGATPMSPQGGMQSGPQPPMRPQAPMAAPQQQMQPSAQPQGGIQLDQLADHIRQQYGDVDPLTMLRVMEDYQKLMKPEDQNKFKELQLQISQGRADTANDMANWKMAQGEPGAKTSRRETEQQALKLGIDPTDKSDTDLNKLVAGAAGKQLEGKDLKRDKLPVAEWRYNKASGEIKDTTQQIKDILAAHPKAIGAYGKIYKDIGGAYGFLEEPEPSDAAAANALAPLFEKLSNSLGAAGSLGGMGASTLTKRWDSVIGGKDWVTNPQKINDILDSLNGDIERFKAPAGETQEPSGGGGWAITPVN